MGLGLVATARIERGETALSVPPSVWRPFSAGAALEAARARAPPFAAHLASVEAQLASGGARGAERFGESVALSLQLLFAAADVGAEGHAYAVTLAPPDVPLFWPQRDAELLRGTGVDAAAAERTAFLRAAHSALFPAGGGVPLAPFASSMALILSRAISDRHGQRRSVRQPRGRQRLTSALPQVRSLLAGPSPGPGQPQPVARLRAPLQRGGERLPAGRLPAAPAGGAAAHLVRAAQQRGASAALRLRAQRQPA